MDQRVIQYYSGELTEEQRRDLLQEASGHPELKKEMVEAQQIESLLSLHASQRDDIEGRISLDSFMEERGHGRRRARLVGLMRYAAVAIACVLCTWWIAMRVAESNAPQPMAQELTVPTGHRAHITLPDGTGVWVNAGSTLRYPSVFGGERRVSVLGEAFFEVTESDRPFIVSLGAVDVKALGTKFNVFNYKGENPSVTLTEGSVKVYRPGNEKGGTVMQTGQTLTATATGFELRTTASSTASWRNGIYAFEREKLGEILRKVELYYDVRITVADPSILYGEYTGKFRQSDGVMEVLRILRKIRPFKIERRSGTGEIVLRR